MASMLKQQGYTNSCMGKWHLGFNWTTNDGRMPSDRKPIRNINYQASITGGPTSVRFDYYFGVDCPNYPPYAFIENDRLTALPDAFYNANKRLLDCSEGSGIKNWPLTNIMPTLRQKAVGFVNEKTKSKTSSFFYLPLTVPRTPIAPHEAFLGKSGLNKYADFVMQVDIFVGETLNSLKMNNALNNTLIVFAGDNGCSPQANFKELEEKGHDPSYAFRE